MLTNVVGDIRVGTIAAVVDPVWEVTVIDVLQKQYGIKAWIAKIEPKLHAPMGRSRLACTQIVIYARTHTCAQLA